MTHKTIAIAALVAAMSLASISELAHAQFQLDHHAPDKVSRRAVPNNRTVGRRISAQKAAAIAERHHHGRAVKVELDRERGRLVYEVDVVAGRREYDVKVDAYTGRIISSKLDDTDYDD